MLIQRVEDQEYDDEGEEDVEYYDEEVVSP